MDQIDWKAELRKIEREYDGLPPEPLPPNPPAEIRGQKLPNIRAREQAERNVMLVAASARLVLVGLLLGALWWWPYANSCGFGLAAFLSAKMMIVVGGIWGAVFAWRNRLVTSHTIAVAFVFAGLALLAAEVLPRLGYVSIAAMGAPHWRCAAGLFP
jgi:hypothetical protein